MAKRNRSREAQKLARQAGQQAKKMAAAVVLPQTESLLDGVVEVITDVDAARALAEEVMNPHRETVLSVAGIGDPSFTEKAPVKFDAAQWSSVIAKFDRWKNFADIHQAIADKDVRFVALQGQDVLDAFKTEVTGKSSKSVSVPFVGRWTIVCYPAGADWFGQILKIRKTYEERNKFNVFLSSCYDADGAFGELISQIHSHPAVADVVADRVPFEGRVTATEVSNTTVMVETPASELKMAQLNVERLLPGLSLNVRDVVQPTMFVSGEMSTVNNEIVTLDGLRQLDDMMNFVREHAAAEGGIVVAGRLHHAPVLLSDLGGQLQTGPGLVDPTVVDPDAPERYCVEVLPGMVIAVNADEDDPPYVHVRLTTEAPPADDEQALPALRAEMVSKPHVVNAAVTLSFFDGGPSWLESVRVAHARREQYLDENPTYRDHERDSATTQTPPSSAPQDQSSDEDHALEPAGTTSAEADTTDEQNLDDELLLKYQASPEPHDLITALEETADRLRSAFIRLEENNEKLSTELEEASRSSNERDAGLITTVNANIQRAIQAEGKLKECEDELYRYAKKIQTLEKINNSLRLKNQEAQQQLEELGTKVMNLVDSKGNVDFTQLRKTMKDSAAKTNKSRDRRRSTTYGGRVVEIKGTEHSDPLEQLWFEISLAHILEFTEEERERFPLDRKKITFGPDFADSLEIVKQQSRDRLVRILMWVVTGRSRTDKPLFTDKRFEFRDAGEERRVYLQHHAAGGRRLHYLLRRDQTIELTAFGLHDDFDDRS